MSWSLALFCRQILEYQICCFFFPFGVQESKFGRVHGSGLQLWIKTVNKTKRYLGGRPLASIVVFGLYLSHYLEIFCA